MPLSRLILFNKPYSVVCQFSPTASGPTLKDYVPASDGYPAGRIDFHSEGLVALTDDGRLQQRIADSREKLAKTYCVQAKGIPDAGALQRLRAGVDFGDRVTRRCKVQLVPQPAPLWPRLPPSRFRRQIPTSWIEIVLSEGKNRQIRRMTARIGTPPCGWFVLPYRSVGSRSSATG